MDFNGIFAISSEQDFFRECVQVFEYQYANNALYREFCQLLKRTPQQVNSLGQIPFLPIEFFKNQQVISTPTAPDFFFSSSGTTGAQTSKHFVADLQIYQKSFRLGFEAFYGNPQNYNILALLPSYLERSGSSLVYMVDDLIRLSKSPHSGFYLNDIQGLSQKLVELETSPRKTLLIGVSFALLDLVEKHQFSLKNAIIMETGGMKGRRKELIREELHSVLKRGFGVNAIHSEYGMTELLSQAYSQGNGVFHSPNWLKIFIRDPEDALSPLPVGKVGGINVIDLANLHSCSFIATQDLGRLHPDGSFEILGRFDNSDVRGCNLLYVS